MGMNLRRIVVECCSLYPAWLVYIIGTAYIIILLENEFVVLPNFFELNG